MLGNKNIIGQIPVGFYPEKDIYHTYDDPRIRKRIVESRWKEVILLLMGRIGEFDEPLKES